MEHMTDLAHWAAAITKDDSLNAISRASGVVLSTLSRQWPDKLSPETVVKIARAYGASVLDALIAQGLIDVTDVATTAALDALQDASDEQLLGEIARRLDNAVDEHPVLTEPATNVIEADTRFVFHAPADLDNDFAAETTDQDLHTVDPDDL